MTPVGGKGKRGDGELNQKKRSNRFLPVLESFLEGGAGSVDRVATTEVEKKKIQKTNGGG